MKRKLQFCNKTYAAIWGCGLVDNMRKDLGLIPSTEQTKHGGVRL